MFSQSKESVKDSVPDRYRRSNFPMFPFNLEWNSDRNNVVLGSPLNSPYDKDMASLEERKFQKMMNDIGRKTASVNKYRGHIPPLVKVKEISLSPVSRRKQLHNVRKHVASKATEQKPENDVETHKTAEKKRKTSKEDENWIYTKKSAQVENRRKVKCDAEVTHVRSTAARIRHALTDVVPGSSDRKRSSSSPVSDWSTRKRSSASINISASDWSSPCIASTTPQVIESSLSILPMPKLAGTIHGLAVSQRPVDWIIESVESKKASVDDRVSEMKAPVEEKKWPITILDKPLKQDTPEFGSIITNVSVAGDYSSERTRSALASLICVETGRSTRGDEQSPMSRGSSRSKSPSYRSSVRGVSKRSRRDRRSRSRSPFSFRRNALVKSGSQCSNRSGNLSVASGSFAEYSPRVSCRVDSRRSTIYHKSISRSQSTQRSRSGERLGKSSRYENKVDRKTSSHVSPSSSSICKVTSSRSRTSRMSSPCDINKSTRLTKPCPSRPKSSNAARCTQDVHSQCMSLEKSQSARGVSRRSRRECRSRSSSISAHKPTVSARLKSSDSGISGIESNACSRSRTSLSCNSSKCVSSGSKTGKGLRNRSPCNVEKTARLRKPGPRTSSRSIYDTRSRSPLPSQVERSARLSKPGSRTSSIYIYDKRPRSPSPSQVEKYARLSKPGSRNSSRYIYDTGSRSPSPSQIEKSARWRKPGSRNSIRSLNDTGSRNPSKCIVKKSARTSKSGSRNSIYDTGSRIPSPSQVEKTVRLSKPISCNSSRSTYGIGSRSHSPCNVTKSASVSKPCSRNSQIKVVDANSGSPFSSKSSICNMSQTCSSGKPYSSRLSQHKSARSCALDEKECIDLESRKLTGTKSGKTVPKSTTNVDILESNSLCLSARSMKSSLSNKRSVRSESSVNSNGRHTRLSSVKSMSSTDKEKKPASSDSSPRYSRSNVSSASSTVSSTARTGSIMSTRTVPSDNGRVRVRNRSRNGSVSTQNVNDKKIGKLPETKSSGSVSSASVKSCKSSNLRLPRVSGTKSNLNNASKASRITSVIRPVCARVADTRTATIISPTTQSSMSDKSTTRTPRQVTTQSSCKSAVSKKKSATPRNIPPVIPARTRSATYSSSINR